jgi:hypothetical protein
MQNLIDQLCSNRYALLFFALFCTIWYWGICTQEQIRQISLQTPVLFYDVPPEMHIEGDESVMITLEGRKNTLFSLAANEIAVHIDGKKLHWEENRCVLQPEMVMLPVGVRMAHCSPATINLRVFTGTGDKAHEEA